MVAAFIAIAALAILVAGQSAPPERQDRGRGAYYNLTRQGFNGFKSNIDPNWEVILGPTATADNLKIFRALRFSLTVNANGDATVSYEIVNPDKLRVEPYVNQIHGNVNRLVTSFFRTWSMFVVSPAPEKDLTEWKLTGPSGTQTIKPQFQKTETGLLLSSYHTNFEPTAAQGIKTDLDVQVEYQEISGMKLPHKVRIKGVHGGEPIEAELEFNNCVLNPR